MLHEESHEVDQPGKTAALVHIAFDYIEGEKVETTEAPDGRAQQEGVAPARHRQYQQRSRHQTTQQKQKSFDTDQTWIGEISHFVLYMLSIGGQCHFYNKGAAGVSVLSG